MALHARDAALTIVHDMKLLFENIKRRKLNDIEKEKKKAFEKLSQKMETCLYATTISSDDEWKRPNTAVIKKLREGIYRYPAQDTWKLIFIWQDLLQQALQKKFRATLEVKKDFWEK